MKAGRGRGLLRLAVRCGAWPTRLVRAAPPPSDSLCLARRAYVVLACGASLPQGLRLLLAAEPAGPMHQALQARLLLAGRHARKRVPRWSARRPRHAPASLRVLDALLAGVSSREQALADWRIQLLSAGLAHLPEQALGDGRAVARRSGDQ